MIVCRVARLSLIVWGGRLDRLQYFLCVNRFAGRAWLQPCRLGDHLIPSATEERYTRASDKSCPTTSKPCVTLAFIHVHC